MSRKAVLRLSLVLAAAFLLIAALGRIGIAEENISAGKSTEYERSGRVIRNVLDNGLTVILEESRFSPVVALMVWVKAGSAIEESGEYGLAHVHEHMLFKGTEKRGVGQIAAEIEGAGGDINAYTSLDETAYYLVIPSRHIELGLDVLSDAMFHSSFDPAELKKELEVVLEEIKRGMDSPTTRLSQELFKTAYKDSPYRRPIIGTEESVSSFTHEKVINFYRKWYTPENIVLVAVGDFKSDTMMQLVNKYFNPDKSDSKKRISPPVRNLPEEPPQRKPRFDIFYGDISEGYVELAFHIPDVRGEDVPALDVLSYIFGAGESSRLYRKVQSEMGLVHSIHSYTFTPKDPGLAIIGASLDPEKFTAALDAILSEIAKLKSFTPGTEEISRAKTNIESETVYSRETVQGEARKLGFYEVIADDLGFEEKYLRAVGNVSIEDIMRVAREYFTPQNITVAAYLPESAKSLKGMDEAALDALVRKALEPPGSLPQRADVKKAVLQNGMTVLIKEHHNVPVVSYRLVMLGGVRLEPPKLRGINNFIARTITKGTAKSSAEELAAEIENMAGSINGFSGRDSMGVQAEFLSRYYAAGFDIFSDVALNPTFISKEVEQQRREIIGDIKRLTDRPDSLTVDIFRKTLFRTHPYGTRIAGEEETVSKITRRDIQAYYRKLLAPSNMVLAVVGDVSADEMMPHIERNFGAIPMMPLEISPPENEPPPTEIRKAEIKREKAQAQIVLGFRGPPLSSNDRYAMEVLANLLGGQGGRLFFELRDKLHLAYAIGAVNMQALDAGIFFVYMGTRPENRDAALAKLIEELEKVRKQPAPRDEIERAKEYIAGSYEISLQTASSQAANLALNERYGLGWMESVEYPERIRRVSPDDVWYVAKKYLLMDRYVLAELLPMPETPQGHGTGGSNR